jgi:hypothetical protein
MIKQLGKHDRLISPFIAAKQWALSNVDPQDLVLTETTGSSEPVALEFTDYTDGTPFVNRECNIALEQQPNDLAIPEAGKSGSGTFFPDREETNQKTKTFKRLIYDQIQKAFYNDYKNPLQIFGIDNIDFPLSKTDRFIGNEFLMFTIPRNVFGDRLAEKTIQMFDHTFDDNLIIVDDGEGNLVAGMNLFAKVQEIRTFGNSIFQESIPDSPSNLVVVSGSAILTWNDNSQNEDGFVIERSLDGLTYTQYVTKSAGSTTHTDNNVTQSFTYYYRVFTFNSVGTSSYSNTASINFPTGSVPDAPSNLVVISGSAILSWDDNSSTEDGFVIERSLDGIGFAQYVTKSADTTTHIDNNVTQSFTYWYRVFAFNIFGASDYSNTASISFSTGSVPTSSCPDLLFEAFKFTGSISTNDFTIYRNTYGTWLPITNSVESSSVSIWARSSDFDTKITVIDSDGNDIGRSESSGYNKAGDLDNAATFITLNQTGSYAIEVASGDDSVGDFEVYVSPGPTQELIYSGLIPITARYISSSNLICVGEGLGLHVVFFDPLTKTIVNESTFSTVYGAVYSPVQDRVYAWATDFTTDFIAEFDNTGSLLSKTTASGVNFSGYPFYDTDNDRMILHSQQTSNKRIIIWDIATKSTIQNINAAASASGQQFGWGTYSEVDRAYYIPQHFFGNANGTMVRIDANTFAVTNTVAIAREFITYISHSQLIVAPELRFIDPLTDSLVGTASYAGFGVFEGAVFDPCINCTLLAHDNSGGNAGGLVVVDQNYQILNFISTATASLNPDSNSLFQYGMCYDLSSSKAYVLLNGSVTNAMYAVRATKPSQTIIFSQTGSFPEKLNAPTDFGGFDGGVQAIVFWSDNSPNELGFALSKSLDGVVYSPLVILSPNTTFYVDNDVTSSNTYWYSLYAFNANLTASGGTASVDIA